MFFVRIRHRGNFTQHLIEGQRAAWTLLLTLLVIGVAAYALQMWLKKKNLLYSRRRRPSRDD